MTLSELSIRRPVLASVVCLLIVVFGVSSLMRIPVRELPNVDRPVVSVTTTYTGAAPEIIDADITEVIDGAIAGVSGVKTISSQSRTGRSRTTVEFVSGRNIDEATNDIRDAVGRVRGRLPDDVNEPRIVKSDADADPVMRIAVVSDRMTAPRSPTISSATSPTASAPSTGSPMSISSAPGAMPSASGSTGANSPRAS
jgi:multidrug efflux pump